MPRGKKSKARARERRDQNRVQHQKLKGAQVRAAKEGVLPSSSAHASADAFPSIFAAGFPHTSQSPVPPADAGTGLTIRSSGKGIKGQVTSRVRAAGTLSSRETPMNDLLKSKTEMLMHYMLSKYKIKQPMRRGEMVRVINYRLKEKFPEILKRACHQLYFAFGLELKEVEPTGKYFKLVSKLHLDVNGSNSLQLCVPTMGILIPLLSVIYINGYCASEGKIWHYLNQIGVYDRTPHIIFGDARKLITQVLVQEKYLEYRQVSDSDPPLYEFLWGQRAYSENCKEEVLDFLIKYHEALIEDDEFPYPGISWEEDNKVQAENAAKDGTRCKAKEQTKDKPWCPKLT
uniref:melanoma-associated antigen B4-like n=1 Tax=Jaculus jaculus TaxID=51337 RepID=UPI001E1B1D59|nr:melanoma-associated antigen B4-like [Jaculus jaculus]